MLAVILLGLAMVICATLAMPWPSDAPGEVRARLVPYWERLAGTAPTLAEAPPSETSPTPAWVWRRVWDGLHLVLILAGVALAALAALRDDPLPWMGLVAVGVLGVFYTTGIALYNGPLAAGPGYLLVLFGAALNVLTWPGLHEMPPTHADSR